MAPAERRLWSAAGPILVGELLILFVRDAGVAATLALAISALIAYRAGMRWLAACAAAWVAVFLAVRVFPGPYDSWAGKAVVPILAVYAAAFLAAWALGRRLAARFPDGSTRARPELVWPSRRRLLAYLLVLLGVAVLAAVLRFWGTVPPVLADNPDAARQVLRARSNIVVGLLSEAWTLGLSISLLRALTGGRRVAAPYLGLALLFTVGAALGASKNSVLVGIVPPLIAVLSVQRPQLGKALLAKPAVVALIGVAAVGAAVYLGGQRTLAGTGTFETEFRSRYGDSALATSVGSLDLSLSSSAETFGRLWRQQDRVEPGYGAYSLQFLGSRIEPLVGKVDFYGTTSQLSLPYYMNTATFVAIPLLDYGRIGAWAFLAVLGLGVGLAERRFEFAPSPARQLGRGFIVYFAVFGVYELYPLIYPTWLSLVPGLWILHRIGRPAR